MRAADPRRSPGPTALGARSRPAAGSRSAAAGVGRSRPIGVFPFAHELRLRVDRRPGRARLSRRSCGRQAKTPYRCVRLPPLPDGFPAPAPALEGEARRVQRMLLDRRNDPDGRAGAARTSGPSRWAKPASTTGSTDLGRRPDSRSRRTTSRSPSNSNTGTHYAQVYAPAGKELICFEPMTAPASALISGDGLSLVAPGEEYRAAFSIAVAGEFG